MDRKQIVSREPDVPLPIGQPRTGTKPICITTLLPHPALRPYVLRYISVEADCPVPLEQSVGSGGRSVLVVLLNGTQQVGLLGGALDPIPPAYLVGHLDRAALNVFTGHVRSFMVHFTATGAYALLGLSVRELANRAADIGADAGPDLWAWAAALAEEPVDATRVASTDQVLLARLLASPQKSHATRVLETATGACELITRAGGRIGVDTLARQLNTTPRTLLRHFKEVVGLPVQRHARIVRFLAMCAHLDRHPDVSWSDVVFRFGYADQSHLVRDFQRFYGESPSVFRARNSKHA